MCKQISFIFEQMRRLTTTRWILFPMIQRKMSTKWYQIHKEKVCNYALKIKITDYHSFHFTLCYNLVFIEGQALIEHQENNNEGFIQFFEAVPRLIRNRLRRRAGEGDQNEESENDNNDEEESESEEEENAEGVEKFDPNLPTQHR